MLRLMLGYLSCVLLFDGWVALHFVGFLFGHFDLLGDGLGEPAADPGQCGDVGDLLLHC